MTSNHIAMTLVIKAPIEKVWQALGQWDHMTVTAWQPPNICDVVHTGRIIKGTGRFELTQIDAFTTRFDWSEEIEAPRAIFLLIAPGLYAGVRISLMAFRRQLQSV
jgi:uncharacterized protein YndB with AHSA1/START domain